MGVPYCIINCMEEYRVWCSPNMARSIISISIPPEISLEIEKKKKTKSFNFSDWVVQKWRQEQSGPQIIEDAILLAAKAWRDKEKTLQDRSDALNNAWEALKRTNQLIALDVERASSGIFPYPEKATFSTVLIHNIESKEWMVREFRVRTSPPSPPAPPQPPKEAVLDE